MFSTYIGAIFERPIDLKLTEINCKQKISTVQYFIRREKN